MGSSGPPFFALQVNARYESIDRKILRKNFDSYIYYSYLGLSNMG